MTLLDRRTDSATPRRPDFRVLRTGVLIEATGTDVRELPAIGIVAETGCRFLNAAGFPDSINAGLAAEGLGTTSVVYRIALFRNDEETVCAPGRFVHAHVDRVSRPSMPLPRVISHVLQPCVIVSVNVESRRP